MGRAAYDDIADWYDRAVTEGPLVPFHEWMVPIVLDLAGDVRALRVCDLACGRGIVSRRLAALGASVVGVDVSARLLETARRYEREKPLGASYLPGDAQTLDGLGDADFDGGVCSMALMDIPNPDATLRAASRVPRPNGWFVLSVVPPIFQTPAHPGRSWRTIRSSAWRSGFTSPKASGGGAAPRDSAARSEPTTAP